MSKAERDDEQLRLLERKMRTDPTEHGVRAAVTMRRLRLRRGHALLFDRRVTGSFPVRDGTNPAGSRGWAMSIFDLDDAARMLDFHRVGEFDYNRRLVDLSKDAPDVSYDGRAANEAYTAAEFRSYTGVGTVGRSMKGSIYARYHVYHAGQGASRSALMGSHDRPTDAASTNVQGERVPPNESWMLYEVSLMPDCGTSRTALEALRDHSTLDLVLESPAAAPFAEIPGRKVVVEPPQPDDFWLKGSAPRGAVRLDVGGRPWFVGPSEFFMPFLRVSSEAPAFEAWVMVVLGGIRSVAM